MTKDRGGNCRIPDDLPKLPKGWRWEHNGDHLVLLMPSGGRFCEICRYGDRRHWCILGLGASVYLSADALKCARVAALAAVGVLE